MYRPARTPSGPPCHALTSLAPHNLAASLPQPETPPVHPMHLCRWHHTTIQSLADLPPPGSDPNLTLTREFSKKRVTGFSKS